MKLQDDADENKPRAGRLENVAIRAATPADAGGMTALANLPGYRHGTLRLPFQTVTETAKWFENPSPGAKQLVAEVENTVVGLIGLTPMAGRRRHVASLGMGVHDDFSGRGIGSALLDAALDLADNWLALRRIELTVFTDNDTAIRLYRKYGFSSEGCLKDYAFRDGHYVDAYTMARLRA